MHICASRDLKEESSSSQNNQLIDNVLLQQRKLKPRARSAVCAERGSKTERENEKEGENKKQALESDIPRRKKTHIAYTQTQAHIHELCGRPGKKIHTREVAVISRWSTTN